MKGILKYLKKYWFFALPAPLFMFGEVMLDLIQPRLMALIVDEGVLGLSNNNVGDLNLIMNTGYKMIGLVALGGCLGILSGIFANFCGQYFANDIRKDVFKKIMSFSFEQTDKFSTGSLVTRVTNDISQVQGMVIQTLRGFIRNILIFAGGIVYLLKLDLGFGVVVACALPLVALCVVFFVSKATPVFSVLQKKLDWLNSVVQENVAGLRVVKAFVREGYEKERFKQANDELVDTNLRVMELFSYMSPILNIIMNISVAAIIYAGSIRVKAGHITPGNVMAAITYITQILHSVMMMAMIIQNLSRGTASMRRLQEVLDTNPAIVGGGFDGDTEIKGKIEFRDVSFSYPGGNREEVLSNINLTIYPGETLGLLGATGSGKSTLVSLVPRFYDPTEGSVLVDGIDVRQYRLNALRNKIAISLQKSELFSATVRENISWGRDGASDKEIEEAALTARASGFIEAMKDGYDTKVAEKGMNLSGGQKQRIAISRAVLKGTEILIFDDSTSALDLKTEAELYDALKKNHSDSTKIIIAQRIASVKGADRIAVIDEGRIVACDTHENLLMDCEIYQDIYDSQMRTGGELHG
ncbi:ABC transporter ATP-binding protein [Parasporobacterium paucivorans]|uniref:ATP-binding cassette, subfamily B n=1 Tax=Parasporobacterium paucivorans DSM 15970 TaxID=1122934 RepID=A0A1M6GNF5_9FIRM|nr:ABC transporter ATP-binding protein [Parasporobacterium paucivorans]SHJ11410.1 ATP-binding cassette, subfamily B [Parasporobacterium paucivorans DSM 15970]